MEEKQFTVMRAWEAGHDKIRYAYRDEETCRVKIGETKFYNWFYVRSFDLEANAEIFKKFLSDGSLVKIKKEGLYARCYYSTVHDSEFLDSNNDKVWAFKNWKVNKMLESLSMLEIQTYEADVPMVKRWLLQENVKICDDYKVLYYDIETDDRWADGLKNLGGHRILSVAMKSSDSKNTDGKMFFLHLKEDSDEAEEEFLRKVARVFDAHDCIIAFNGSNFDDVYVKSRFARYGIEIDWRKKFLQDALWTFKKYGPQMQSYSLDKIAKSILDRGKVEHEGMRIYDMWKNDPALLKKYNIEDVQLMYEIECKTGYLNAHRGICAFGMCFVDDLFVLHKIDNFVLKQAQEDKLYHFKTVVRNYDAEEEKDDGATYAGAFVFDPIAGLHKHVKVLDFSSLYPNTINTFNISPDTFIEDKDLDKYDMKDVITTPTGHHYRKDFVGIIPKVIMSLKSKREYWKEKMSHETYGSVMHKVYDRMQYLYKYFGLSFYGCMGEKHSRFYDTRVAESVTLTGQHFTKTCAAFVKDKYGAKIVYGDSVTGERCTVIKMDGLVQVISFEDLYALGYDVEGIDGKEYRQFNQDIQALSYNFETRQSEFKPIERIMRHKTDKNIYLYRQRDGVTCCTEDHSLIDKNGNRFKPNEGFKGFSIENAETQCLKKIDLRDFLSENDKWYLLENDIIMDDLYFRYKNYMFKRHYTMKELYDIAILMAHYICNGHASIKGETTSRYLFGISNKDLVLLEKLLNIINHITEHSCNVKILKDADKKSHTHRLYCGNKFLPVIFKVLCGIKYNGKKIPNYIYNVDKSIQKTFVDAMIEGDGNIEHGRLNFESASINVISGMSYLYKSLGYNVSVDANVKSGTFTAKTKINENYGKHLVKNILVNVENKSGYVYDLTVQDNHNFVDAMGNLLLHNTDSFFFTHEELCKDHNRILDLSEELSTVCFNESVKKRNCNVCTLKMSYDKSFTKYLILNGKKRYAGVIDYLDGHEYTEFKMYVAGFEYKRTDSCLYVKNKQYELLKMILTETPDYEFIRKYVLDMKNEVCGGKLPLSDIIFAQKITKELDSYGKQMHARVAREMEQDGKSVYIGDKIEYYVSHLDENGDPVVKPSYKFNGQYARTYYWNNKIFPAIQRILEVVYDKIDWNNYLVSNKKVTTHSRSLW